MPTYDFQCKKCQNIFDEICGFEEKIPCPKCKSKRTERLLTIGLPIGINGSFDFRAKTNYERATRESAAAREAVKGKAAYKNIDDISRGMNYVD
jgi:putative FmdB family regulatory protein